MSQYVANHPTPPGAVPTAGYLRVVVAIGTDGGVAAIDLARELAAADAAIILARVHHSPRATPAGGAAQAKDRAETVRLLKVARTALDRPCEIVAEEDADLVTGLHRVAEREQADLLVLGPHRGLRHNASALPGVLHGAPCAVAIVGQQQREEALALRKIGVGHCTSADGEHAAVVASALAHRSAAELHAMHVVPVVVTSWLGPAAAALHTLQRLDGTLAQEARAAIGGLGEKVVGHVTEGDPVDGLSHFAADLDLLVVGARHMGRLRRLVVGSTSSALSTRCPSALLVAGVDEATPPPD